MRPDLIRGVGTAFELRFYRRWGWTYMDAVSRDGLGETEKAELIWLDRGKQHRAELGERGRITGGRIAVTSQWPLAFAVVQYHPRVVRIQGEWVSNAGVCAPDWEEVMDAPPRDARRDVDGAAQRILENIRAITSSTEMSRRCHCWLAQQCLFRKSSRNTMSLAVRCRDGIVRVAETARCPTRLGK